MSAGSISACCEAVRRLQSPAGVLEGYACPIHGTQWTSEVANHARAMIRREADMGAFSVAVAIEDIGKLDMIQAKARAWDAFRALFGTFDPNLDSYDADESMDAISRFVTENASGAPTPKGPRAIAEQVVASLMFEGSLPITLAAQAVTLMFGGHPDAREHVTATIAEIIAQALRGAP